EVLGLDDLANPELDIKGIRVAKVLDLHGSNERSKKVLCTVSPSASNTARAEVTTDATVGLDLLSHRMLDDMLDPLQPNHRTVRAQPDRLEVSPELQAPDGQPWPLT